MLKLKKPSKMLKQELKFKPIDRRQIKTTSKFDELKMKKKAQIVADSEKKNNKESIGK